MAAEVKNATLIRAVLDGGHLQFRHSGAWVDCGGDASTWMSLLVCAGADGTYRIKPGTEPHGVLGNVEGNAK